MQDRLQDSRSYDARSSEINKVHVIDEFLSDDSYYDEINKH